MVAILMTEILNFTTIEEKHQFYNELQENFIKDKMTGRVDIVWRIFQKTAKKLKLK